MVRYVGFLIVARANVGGNAPQQALVALDVTGIMSTLTREETVIEGHTSQKFSSSVSSPFSSPGSTYPSLKCSSSGTSPLAHLEKHS